MKRIPTPSERRKFNEYLKRGYTMAVWHLDGGLIPGYHDWAIADVLAALELQDQMNQIQLRLDSKLGTIDHACITETTDER